MRESRAEGVEQSGDEVLALLASGLEHVHNSGVGGVPSGADAADRAVDDVRAQRFLGGSVGRRHRRAAQAQPLLRSPEGSSYTWQG